MHFDDVIYMVRHLQSSIDVTHSLHYVTSLLHVMYFYYSYVYILVVRDMQFTVNMNHS